EPARRVPGRGGRRGEDGPPRPRVGAHLPDRLAGALRPRGHRGARLRDAGRDEEGGRAPRAHRGREDGLPERRRRRPRRRARPGARPRPRDLPCDLRAALLARAHGRGLRAPLLGARRGRGHAPPAPPARGMSPKPQGPAFLEFEGAWYVRTDVVATLHRKHTLMQGRAFIVTDV